MSRVLAFESPRLKALAVRGRTPGSGLDADREEEGRPTQVRKGIGGAQGGHEADEALTCDLCASPISNEHRHLVDTQARELRCICRACCVLFDHRAAGGGHYRLVPEQVWRLEGFDFPAALWQAFAVPVDMAFFFRSSTAGGVVAFYPGPMGATESRLGLERWPELELANPVLEALEPDVEALLVNRVNGGEGYWIVPVDVCYQLVAVMRSGWKGFAGGPEVWAELALFFDRLQDRSEAVDRVGPRRHAATR